MNIDNLDGQLRQALRRETAPPDFARNVLARATPFWRRPVALALAAGLVTAAVIPPAISEHRRRERERALEAEAQLFKALTITQAQLRRVGARLQRNTRRPL